MAEAKAKTRSVGSVLRLPTDPAEVTGPDGIPVLVTGGAYVLDRPGVHVIDGDPITAK